MLGLCGETGDLVHLIPPHGLNIAPLICLKKEFQNMKSKA